MILPPARALPPAHSPLASSTASSSTRLAGWTSIAVAVALAGCAGASGPNPDIERARTEVNRVAAEPVVSQRAPLELKAASDTVEQADAQWRDKGNSEEARHRAYLASQRAAIAEQVARAREADERIKTANMQVDRARLSAAQAEATTQALRADAADARAAALEAQLREIEATKTDRGLLVTLGDLLFQTGRADLLPNSYARIDRLANFLRQNTDRRLIVEGHTDSVGGDALNLALSQRRAEAVRAALVQRGVDPSRISTYGYGKAYPVADNSSAEGRAMNRRVEVLIADERGTLRPR